MKNQLVLVLKKYHCVAVYMIFTYQIKKYSKTRPLSLQQDWYLRLNTGLTLKMIFQIIFLQVSTWPQIHCQCFRMGMIKGKTVCLVCYDVWYRCFNTQLIFLISFKRHIL